MNGKGRVVLAITAALAAAGPLKAQTTPLNSVVDREERNQAGDGIRAGAFTLRPSASVVATYTDNVFATTTNRRDDVFFNLRGIIAARSNWSANQLNARAYIDQSLYTSNGSEDATQYGAQVDGRYEFTATTAITARANVDRLAELRSSINSFRGTRSRSTYVTAGSELGVNQLFGPLSVGLSGAYRVYRFDPVLVNNVLTSARFRDLDILSGTLDASYGLSDSTRFVLFGVLEQRRYQLRPGDPGFDPITQLDRSADGGRIEAGITRNIGTLLQATVRLGYLNYSYPDARLRPISAFSFHVDVNWNVTPLTTVQLAADRRVDETSSPVNAGNLRNEGRFGIQHELLRNLILFGGVRYAQIDPSGVGASSSEFQADAGARYYIARRLRIDLSYTHNQRTSTDPTIAFRNNLVLIGLTLFR